MHKRYFTTLYYNCRDNFGSEYQERKCPNFIPKLTRNYDFSGRILAKSLGLFQKKIPGRGRRQAIYFSMGGWCGKFSNYMGQKLFCGFSMGRNQYWAGRVYDLCVYYMTGTPEGSTESGFMEKPGIEPATPGLQGIALIHYTKAAIIWVKKTFLWLSWV